MQHEGKEALLRTEGLTRRFGGLVAVSDVDFDILPGEILGLIGPNGAGKSTTFNLISGFYKPSAGKLTVFGENCTGKSPLTISRMGLVRTFQHGSLMPSMSVRDNILLGTIHGVRGAGKRRERAAETAEMLGLTPYLSEEAGTLPHGIQRLVSIGIAFAARPRLLCLDEPLTGLNQTEVANTLAVLEKIRDEHGCSVLLVEHNMKAVMKVCDRIVVLHHGQVLASGTPAEIRADKSVIEAYLGHRHAN
ncbi:ABC transporter ATP-binding protein [Pseudohoeflea coraliihabitans]|uniref:ABC transporter ATP-binding protein n=1 Tax=Pseudohoeflea coraliihabitans TaxID=2860393 RepID=A0ABS6WQD2_9HYPH|nr:ABC transporter ATP-binding protein [Pseudohoeflea sp. DP4N28-3]MBW3098182.1 ABC transporter ATP-binding protein [Pseudohoeflea sp. DP4N28-3]